MMHNPSNNSCSNSEKKPNCYECEYKRTIPGDSHVQCVHPESATPDAQMTFIIGGDRYTSGNLTISAKEIGINQGWFMWPINFDPVWLKKCSGFKSK